MITTMERLREMSTLTGPIRIDTDNVVLFIAVLFAVFLLFIFGVAVDEKEAKELLVGIADSETDTKDERIRQLELENEALRNENDTLKSALLDVSATASEIKNVLDSRKV